MAEEIERLNYYQLQFLGADDFKAEQVYHRDMRRRHNLGPHTWGIVEGLELDPQPPGGNTVDVYITPGYAIDGFGREIVVGARTKLDASEFRFIKPNTKPVPVPVYIAFAEEQAAPPAFGYGACDGAGHNDRVRELFRIVIAPRPPLQGPVQVDGDNVDLTPPPPAPPVHDSIPHQELPDTASARWLIQLGTVTWDGTAFIAATSDQRRYAGALAAEVLAPAQTLVLRPLKGPADPDEFAVVEGPLRVTGTTRLEGDLEAEKDVVLLGSKVSFATTDKNVTPPLWLSRISRNTGEKDLHIQIGSATGQAQHRLTIGPMETEYLIVSADDKVRIPTGTLEFGPPNAPGARRMITVTGDKFGIGVDGKALYNLTDSEFLWRRGGSLAMKLDAMDRLTVTGGIDAPSLRVVGDAQVGGNVNVDGSVRLLDQGGNDFDELALTRHKKASNQNDLRVIIGDDLGGDDAFTIGPIYWQDNQYKENFRVNNRGDVNAEGNVSMTGNLTVKGKVTGSLVIDDLLTVTKPAQFQSATFNADITLASGKVISYGGKPFPIDVKSGRVTLPIIGGPLTVLSDLPQISDAFVQVAIVKLKRNAGFSPNDDEWGVEVVNKMIQPPNVVAFDLQVTATGNAIVEEVSYVVIFVP